MNPITHKMCFFSLFYLCIISCFPCKAQDPWDLVNKDLGSKVKDNENIPPDLRILPRKKISQSSDHYGMGEWFYRRILSIILRSGQVKENEDGSVDISLQMRLDQKQRNTLNEYLTSTSALSEDKLRRSLGFIEQSIYEPSLPTKLILAWSDYVQMSLAEYKDEITWTLAFLAVATLLFWLWRHLSHKNAIIVAFVVLYAYEVFITYKEAEQKEIEMFVTAVNSCKWYVWSSKCELPKPDPLIFLKHMNPLKIGLRMFTSIVSEPVIVLSDTVKTLTHGITDGLLYPFNVIMFGILITFFHMMLLIFLITILFNFILNIPINLSFGLFSVGLRQRKRSVFSDNRQQNQNISTSVENTNFITGATLDKLLSLLERATHTPNKAEVTHHVTEGVSSSTQNQIKSVKKTGLKRSASTGRLPNLNSFENYNQFGITKRNVGVHIDGSGDAR